MIRKAITVFGFLMTLMLACMAIVLICSINLVLNGYHRECGSTAKERIWRNAVPFMCSPKAPAEQAVRARALPRKTREPKAAPAPHTVGTRRSSRCAPLQQEPYRVQCDPEVGCYYDLGHRANCGLADNWDGRK